MDYYRKKQIKKLLISALLGICLCNFVQADLAKRINGIVGRSSQKKVQYSIHIVRARNGKAVYNHNATNPLIPASNMKIITTAAALKYLGPNFRYETKVGLLDDTLVIIAGGDPLLGDKATDAKYGREPGWIFEDIAAALKQNGIKTIKDIIIDTSVFDDQRVHPNWPKKDLNRWYACEVCGLNYNGNCIEVTTKNIDGKVSVYVEPKTDFVKITNKVAPISKGTSKVGSYRTTEANKIILKGKCNKQAGPFGVAIERPAAFFGFMLAEHLAKSDIAVQGQLTEKNFDESANLKILTQYNTPLNDCLARCNKDSLGLAAEALLKTIAAQDNQDKGNGSWEGGQKLISKYLSKIGIDKEQFNIDDASGLSRKNALSARAITKVLFNIYKSGNWKLYRDSLAAGGIDGTISKYFTEPKYKGKILGKTGYIYEVKSFSGVCTTERGDFLFSIIANNANAQTRAAINEIAKAIINEAE